MAASDGPVQGRFARLRAIAGRVSAWFGALVLVGLIAGFVVDFLSIDQTSGGYEPPYTDFTGEPIDWDSETYTTSTGMVSRGYVMDVHTDCTTGMIRFEILRLVTFDYRPLSDRALAIHEPRQACLDRGFQPEF